MSRWGLLLAAALSCLAMPAIAQDVAPEAAVKPAAVATAAPVADSNVGPFYASRPSTLIWLRDATSRAAAMKLSRFSEARSDRRPCRRPGACF